MPVLADFTVIRGDSPITIGDNNTSWDTTFNTGGRHNSAAVLMFNIQHLTHTHRNVVVKVNGNEVGRIYPYSGEFETAKNWYTQIITLTGSQLKSSGNNQLRIQAVRLDPEDTTGTNVFDDFNIKDVVCFFHQEA